MANGKPKALLEIKSPIEGDKKNIKEVVNHLKYLQNVNGNLFLKQNHAYYAQVQLGMSILNLKSSYFIIFCSFDKSSHVLKIYYDYEFSSKLLRQIKSVYFGKMLHNICSHK